MKTMKGIVTALTTPFTEKDAVNYGAMERSVEFLVSKGIGCMYVCGTTGEMHLLTVEERQKLAETIIAASDGKADIFVHCGAMTTADTCRLIDHARSAGADGIGAVTPSFFGMDEAELMEYYGAVSRAAGDLPVYMYNIPQCSGNDISARLCEEIADRFENIVGIKYSWNNSDRMADYLRTRNYRFSVLGGMEKHILPYHAMGCDGVVSGCSNAFPELFLELYRACVSGDIQKACVLQRKVQKLVGILTRSRSIARVKAAQGMRGLDFGAMRAPCQPIGETEKLALREELQEFLP